MKILALDYDGVIVDSKFECLAVGFNAYLRINPKTRLFSCKRFTFENFDSKLKNNEVLVDKYIKLRPFVIDGFCWNVILHIIENNLDINNQDQYNKIREKLMPSYDEYDKYFYEERTAFQKDFDKWLGMQKPFGIIDDIKKLGENFILTIVTNNKKENIVGFLEKFGIKVEIISDCTIGINKVKQIEYIKNKLNVEYSDFYFLDDQVSHFKNLKNLGVKCFLATWGYNNEKQREEAKKHGIYLINEENFYEKLNKK